MKQVVAILAILWAIGFASGQIPGGGGNSVGPVTWTTFSPSLTCGTATFSVNNARFKTLGKTTTVALDFTVTGAGTCNPPTIPFTFTWPTSVTSSAAITGIETVNGRQAVSCITSSSISTATCLRNANVGWAANDRAILSGVYENP